MACRGGGRGGGGGGGGGGEFNQAYACVCARTCRCMCVRAHVGSVPKGRGRHKEVPPGMVRPQVVMIVF